MEYKNKTKKELINELTECHRKIGEMEKLKAQLKLNEKVMRMAIETAVEEKGKTEALFEAIGDGISVQDTQYRIIYQNRSHRKLAGDHLGNYCYRAYQSRDQVCEECHVEKPFGNGGSHKKYESRVTSEGTRYYEIVVSPLHDPAGEVIAGMEMVRDVTATRQTEAERENLLAELQNSLSKIKKIKGLLPICASCKKIRDDNGYWNQLEEYLRRHSEIEFTHGVCPECVKLLYPHYQPKGA